MNIHAAIELRAQEELRRPLTYAPDSKNVVALDFDGVLSKSDGPYARAHFGPPIKEGFKLLRMLLQRGYQVVVFTARKETDLVAKWLAEHGAPRMFVTNHKVPAVAYIDDRAISWADDSKADDIIKYVKSPKKVLELRTK